MQAHHREWLAMGCWVALAACDIDNRSLAIVPESPGAGEPLLPGGPLGDGGSRGTQPSIPIVTTNPGADDAGSSSRPEPAEMTARPPPDAGESPESDGGVPPMVSPPAPTTIPIGEGLALTPAGGWISGSSNELGIQGSFFTLTDASAQPGGSRPSCPRASPPPARTRRAALREQSERLAVKSGEPGSSAYIAEPKPTPSA